ncbi:MAG: hypothetical protein MJ231_06625 [bacterium]|nr:hypothetical protein [bacterium]
MARDIINVQYPTLDHSESVANIGITETTVTVANGITIADAFSNKNNSLFIVIANNDEDEEDSAMTVKAGNAYPNAMLGDITIEIPAGVSAIQLQDLSRFEKADGSIDLDFATGFTGTIYAIAKWAGVKEVAQS